MSKMAIVQVNILFMENKNEWAKCHREYSNLFFEKKTNGKERKIFATVKQLILNEN